MVTGEYLAKMRMRSQDSLRLAEAIVDGAVTVTALTPRQANKLYSVARRPLARPAVCSLSQGEGAEASPGGLGRRHDD